MAVYLPSKNFPDSQADNPDGATRSAHGRDAAAGATVQGFKLPPKVNRRAKGLQAG
jgi:hypothetical protein